MPSTKFLSYDDYTTLPKRQQNDRNTYSLGSIGGYHVVIACLPSGLYGTTSAALVAEHMSSTFPNVKWGLVEVSRTRRWTFVWETLRSASRRIATEAWFDMITPPLELLTAIADLESTHFISETKIPKIVSDVITRNKHLGLKLSAPRQHQDTLFNAAYEHLASNDDCAQCDRGQLVDRPVTSSNVPRLYYGLIASGNQVMRDGQTRERLGQELGILCFEMESTGLMDHFPCLVIQGICDYADSHKNKHWQGYAALTAAAYGKELLSAIPKTQILTGLDRLSTMSVLAALVQFTDFSGSILTETVTVHLEELTDDVEKSFSSAKHVRVSSLEPHRQYERLQQMCKECVQWESFRVALKSVWEAGEIDQLVRQLELWRCELKGYVHLYLQHFESFSQDTRRTMRTLFNTKLMLPVTNQANHHTGVKKRRARIVASLLESLRFPQMDHRADSITAAHRNTFTWIFRDVGENGMKWDGFLEWLVKGSGTYWMQGKAASGKSTLIRFIWDHPQTWTGLRSWSKNGQLIAGVFFFWNSGVEEQRSQTGLFRTLLFKVLSECRELIPEVLPEEWEERAKLAAQDKEMPELIWSIDELQRAFTRLVTLARDDMRMCFFIDGLNEYDGNPERIAEYIHDLSDLSTHAKFGVSSRPWSIFQDIFNLNCQLRLQDLTKDDFRLYVRDKLGRNKQMQLLLIDDSDGGNSLIHEIVEKADGIFLWVELVCLADLLVDLEKLYDRMLERIEPRYREEPSEMLQIFRASGHSLNVMALYRALLCPSMTTKEDLIREALVERTMLKLNSRCKGLLEVHSPFEYEPLTQKYGPFPEHDGAVSMSIADAHVLRQGIEDEPPQLGLMQHFNRQLFTPSPRSPNAHGTLQPTNGNNSGITKEHRHQILYLHRTARDFLEQPRVWKAVTDCTKRSSFDPSVSFTMAYVLQAKKTPVILQAKTVYEAGQFMLSKIASFTGKGSSDLIVLIEDTGEWMLYDNPKNYAEWKIYASKRAVWGEDLLSIALKVKLDWYIQAKISMIASPVFLARSQQLPLPSWSTHHRQGLPLLAFALFLLENGADPNEVYEGYIIWQYTVHYLHVDSDYLQKDLCEWLDIFKLMLKYGADLNTHCIED
ncbi:uncharacterized protein KD926_005908 [Aspergillus affinis]|uniref:uncharacterized protein n=1 Tax=Aspergillus affinis TaxID=1070780 RepID=UPI0022FDB88A|nr:uncharacterized protein KD926_005908 [Aspergillus affinis]KAI9045964.1 hypothetical protein KD926_005908 [Aspergillus affinis]